MTDRKPCIRCGRLIDGYARACPFCSWDQSATPPAKMEAPSQPAYVPPGENRWRNKIIGLAAFVALVVIAFVVGTFIHGFGASEVKAAQKNASATPHTTTAPPPAPRNTVTLVPVSDTNPAPVEQPITSTPPQAPGQQPNDATALPSTEYAAAAARAKAQQKAASVDPRTIKATPFETPQPAPPRRTERELPPPMTSAQEPPHTETRQTVMRTEAVPEYQPVPELHVDRDTTAHLLVTVGADGRVKDIEIVDSIPGQTSRLIQAVQRWRFRPAMENGVPVTGRVSVAITVRANE
jgi:TonB family protein